MTKIPIALAFLCLASTAHADSAVYRAVLDGRIRALLSVNAEGGESYGQILYEAGTAPLSLEIKMLPVGAFDWQEKVEPLWSRGESERAAGRFTGTLSGDRKSGTGTWKSADGKKTLPFTLTRVATFTASADSSVDARVEFPRMDEARYAKLNAHWTREAEKELAARVRSVKEQSGELKEADSAAAERLSSSTSCDLESATPELVSLLCIVDEYMGGAHGMSVPEGRTYALAPDGTPKPLGLWDLLRKSPANTKKLSGLLLAELKRQEATFVVEGSVKGFEKELSQDELPFTVLPAGLAFHFAPYAVGPYAEGPHRVLVPNRALAGMIRRDGWLAARAGKP